MLPPAVLPDVDILPPEVLPEVLPPAVLPVMPPPEVLPLPDMPPVVLPVVPAVLLPVVPPAVVPLLEPMLPLELVPLLASILVSPGMVLDESVRTPDFALFSEPEFPALASSALFLLLQALSSVVLSASVTSGAIIFLVNMDIRYWFE